MVAIVLQLIKKWNLGVLSTYILTNCLLNRRSEMTKSKVIKVHFSIDKSGTKTLPYCLRHFH